MRYVLAMISAVACAALAAIFLSGPVSSWLSKSFTYTSPDGQNDMEQFAFLTVMIAALALGWAIGWMLGARFAERERLD